MEWKEYKLGDVCEITSSKRIFYSEYEDSGVPFYRSKEIINLFNKQEIATELFISEERYKEIKEKFGVPQKNDILLTSVGSIGIPYLVKENDKFYFKDGNLTWIRNYDARKIDPLFLYIWIISEVGKRTLEILSMGAAQAALTISRLKEAKIFLPSINEQRAIASILSNYDTLIDTNTKRIKLLEESARELYKEWFVRMRFPGYEQTKFVKGIPEGWKYASLQGFGRIETGKTPSMEKPEYYGGDYLFIKTPDMHDSMFVSKTSETLSEAGNNCQKNKLLPVNSIMVSCIGSTGIGTVAINAKQGHTNQQINSIILNNQEWLTWLYFTCESLKPTIEMYGATGSTMTNLSKGKFENLKVIEPTTNIIRQFNRLESPLFEGIKNLQLQIQNIASTRDRLLPRLLSGELKVKA